MSFQLSVFDYPARNDRKESIINVASIPQRSPFRYPGGKTWLIPQIRSWLKSNNTFSAFLIEPFAGGGIVSLTAAFENLSQNILMTELDEEIAAVWDVIINDDALWLANKIFSFDLTIENVKLELAKDNKSLRECAFCTILKNRVFHGGIMTKGSGMLKYGENGKGISSRWYPKTLKDRIIAINEIKDRLEFKREDAFTILKKYEKRKKVSFFIDPPYTIAGKRLYTYFDIDHERLFYQTAKLKGNFLLTYDDTPEIRKLAKKHKLKFVTVPMKTTHHLMKSEILISDDFSWFNRINHR